MSNLTPRESRRVRFEEVTPTNTIVAFFDARLTSLAASHSLPIYPGYDDLDNIEFAFLTLPSGQTVTLGQYENSPQIGIDLYVDLNTPDIPGVVFEACQQLAIPRSQVVWFHPDFAAEIERLYSEHGDIAQSEHPAAGLLPSNRSEPIDCFYHALEIYSRQKSPLYWGMLQHNLGLAYFSRIDGDRQVNLERSIGCFHNSLEIYTQDEFPDKWQINQEDLKKSRMALDEFYRTSKVRDLNIEDLLGRKAIAPSPELLQHDITDRVVLVTGGGGSIGSELCRQIAKLHPKRLIIFELNEFALYQIDMELGETYPELTKSARLGSVSDAGALTNVFKVFGVETVYHAAAYKHVPIVEANPLSGVVNNIGGTLIAAQCALACGVKKFVLISTDKAVRPTNIMGATKRVAELLLQGLADLPGGTCFTMVRFGNVLGNSGAILPRFREQITAGKPLTVTHPDITRYFMTIPEAATLVIQAGAMAKGGEVFLLDMGEPVKIYDLAKQLIRLHGLEPNKDVQIEITGLRPGEKIHEELLINCDRALPTSHPKIFCARESKIDWKVLSPQLTYLLEAANNCDVTECVSILRNLVPEYQPMGKYAATDWSGFTGLMRQLLPMTDIRALTA